MSDLYRLDCKIPAHTVTRHLGECFVEVEEICIVHWEPPVDGRGFCAGASWPFDCDVREVDDE